MGCAAGAEANGDPFRSIAKIFLYEFGYLFRETVVCFKMPVAALLSGLYLSYTDSGVPSVLKYVIVHGAAHSSGV